MKKSVLLLVLAFVTLTTFGQDITGKWSGKLVVPGAELRVDFNLTKTADGYTSTMDSPDQGAYGIATTSTKFENSVLTITITELTIEYVGTLNKDNIIDGTFKQSGQSFEMDLTKEKKE